MKRVQLLCVAIVAWMSLTPGYGSVLVTIDQEGGDVVAWGGGTLDIRGLGESTPSYLPIRMWPAFGDLSVGWSGTWADGYSGVWGPSSFGAWAKERCFLWHGRHFWVRRLGDIVCSGELHVGLIVVGVCDLDRHDAGELGLSEGFYTWYWGSGIHMDSFTVCVVPEPSGAILLGVALLGLRGAARGQRPQGRSTQRL